MNRILQPGGNIKFSQDGGGGPALPAHLEGTGGPGKTRILLVDDDEDNRLMTKRMISDDKRTVKEAVNGMDATRIIESEEFDVVITDRRMPGMWADQLIPIIREKNPGAKVLLMTADTLKPAEIDNISADAYIRKPFTSRQIERILTDFEQDLGKTTV